MRLEIWFVVFDYVLRTSRTELIPYNSCAIISNNNLRKRRHSCVCVCVSVSVLFLPCPVLTAVKIDEQMRSALVDDAMDINFMM